MTGKKADGFRAGRRAFLKTVSIGAGTTALFPIVPAAPAKTEYPSLAQLRTAHEKEGIIPPNKTYRMMEWEFHTPPLESFHIDVEGALKAARDAGAESMMFYSQDHWGYAYYSSDGAVRHPHLNYDLFGKEVNLARKLGMSIVCYYSLQFNNQSVLSHPDWGWLNGKGEQQRLRWYIP
jgi:hypothetical protein